MPWLRSGDTSATHPLVMALAVVKGADERTTNEVFGYVCRLATQSSAHLTDYRVDYGTALLFGGKRTDILLQQAVEAGLLQAHGRGKTRTWSIVQDDEFLHMPSKAETLWRRQRDRDRKNPALTAPVRQRDGDECRYCRKIVNWGDHRGAKGGTYDHLAPGEAGTVDTLVVACKSCNSTWSDTDFEVKREKLLPPPQTPFYSEETAAWLTKRGYPTQATPPTPRDEQGGADTSGSTPERSSARSRPWRRDTAVQPGPEPTGPGAEARPRPEPTGSDTAALARDLTPGHRRAPGSDPNLGTTQPPPGPRPDFVSDTAAPAQARPGGHAPDPAPPQRMEDPPPTTPGDVQSFRPHSMEVDGNKGWNPGRVGSGVGSGGASAPDPALPCPARPGKPSRGRRKRARRSKET